RAPAWQPDGRKIAWVHVYADGNSDIWIMNPDGSKKRALTHLRTGLDGPVSWSPDGRRLAFDCPALHFGTGSAVCIVNADGSGLSRAKRISQVFDDTGGFAWSPIGDAIALTVRSAKQDPVTHGFLTHIYVSKLDGSDMRKLTSGHGEDSDPVWS